jgi:tetratricopeptide (TPR) repeat protein
VAAVFISYRRRDGGFAASRCYSYLVERLGKEQVVLDHEGMRPGTRYPDWLRAELVRSVVLVALIDRNWVRRLTVAGDWVRLELTYAIEHGIPIIPVLLDEVRPPTGDALPEAVREVSRRQYTPLRLHGMEDDLHRIADAVVREAPELMVRGLFAPAAAGGPPAVPTALLRPEREAVPFRGRKAEADAVAEWAGTDRPLSVGLLTGGAGAGKTRLAVELCRTLGAAGWAAGLVGDGWDADRLGRLGLLAGLQADLLLVVDRAETRVDLVSSILARLVATTGEPRSRIRVLLVARSDGPWFGQLREVADDRVQAVIAPAPVWPVGQLLAPSVSRSAEFDRAAAAFADALDLTVPATAPDLSGTAYEDLLSVHAAALAAVLATDAPVGDADPADPLGQILRYERDYWLSTAPAGPPPAVLRERCQQTVAAVTLCGPRTSAQLRALLRVLPTFEGVDGGTLDAWADWVAQLYPAASGRLGLTPEPVAERFLAAVLADRPELAPQCAAVATDDQLRRMFALTGRIAGRDAAVADVLRTLLDPPSGPRVGAAVTAAGELADPAALVTVLSAVIADPAGSLDLARSVIDRLPDGSRALAPLAVDTITVALGALRARPDLDLPLAAYLRTNLAGRLLMLGLTDEARRAADAAVTAYQALAFERPEMYTVPLAAALGNQAIARFEGGDPEAARGPAEEALRLFRAARPGRSGVRGLVKTALLLAELYGRAGRAAEQRELLDEAAGEARAVAADIPGSDDDRALLAQVLENLALARAGADPDAAVGAMRESVTALERLAYRRPDPYRARWVRGLVLLTRVELRVDPGVARRTAARAVEEARMLTRTGDESAPALLAEAQRLKDAMKREPPH